MGTLFGSEPNGILSKSYSYKVQISTINGKEKMTYYKYSDEIGEFIKQCVDGEHKVIITFN